MGAANSRAPAVTVLDRVVAQTQTFPWSINHGILANSNKCSIFVHKKAGPGSEVLCRQFIKNLKLCRHPYILHFIESQEDAEAIYLVTEPVVPLGTYLKDAGELDIALGVHTLATALKFLHENVKMCHNNIKVSSIFVGTSDNLWRLGGAEFITKPEQVDSTLIGHIIRAAGPEHPASPEDIDGTFSSNNMHCRDSWMLGHMISHLMKRFNGKPDGELMKFKQNIRKFYCSADPRKRPSMETLLSSQYFKAYPQHALINSVDFLESITIKGEEEKKCFFRKASSDLFHVSSDLFQKYLIRLMFSDLIFADENAREYLLPRLLSVKTKRESKGFYKAESYAKIMAPVLKELYKRRAKHTRLVLLRLSRWYAPFLPNHYVKDNILPEILVGLNDTDDAIVMATFNALAVLTSFLGSKTVVGSSLQKSHFHDSFPRNANPLECSEPVVNEGITESSFAQGMEGRIINDSDIDSGREYQMFHGSRQDMLKAEREKRANEFKKRREAKKKKETESKQTKLIDVAACKPGPSNFDSLEQPGPSSKVDGTMKMECLTHQQQKQLLIHEQQGYSMEYKATNSDDAQWGSDGNLDLDSEADIPDNKSLLELVKESATTCEVSATIAESEDGNLSTPVNRRSQVVSDSENIAEIQVSMEECSVEVDVAGELAPQENDGFSQWENGGWSDFDNQFESDAGIELATLNEKIAEEDDGKLAEVPIEQVPSNVSDVMDLERAVVQEPDFFADMQPKYTAPKLL